MSALNLIFYKLSGNMKLSLEKKIVGAVVFAILLIALLIILYFQSGNAPTLKERYVFLFISGINILVLTRIFFVLRRDITGYGSVEEQLKSSRELLQQYMDSAYELVQSVAMDGSFITVNKSWLKTLGYSEADMKDLKIFEIVAPESQKAFAEIFRKLTKGEEFENFEVTYITKEGKKVILEGNSTNLIQQGNMSHARSYFRDITDRRSAEKELKQLNEELEHRVQQKTVELGKINNQLEKEIIEHKQIEQQLRHLSARLQSVREEERKSIAREIHDELGQQLTGIKMDLSWLHKKIDYEAPAELQDKVKVLVGLIDTTIKTVRKIATELRPGLLDDLGLIAAIEWQCSEFEKRNGIKCIFNTRLEDADFGNVISTEVFRIVQETLTNILRHAQATEVEIQMSVVQDNLIVQIADNGRGISKAEIQNTTSLGLLGMGERAKILNGRFSIQRPKPYYTTMINILITDDHTVVREGLKRILKEEFPEATFGEAGDGNQALEKTRSEVWDVIILDITMSGRNGLEVLKQMRAENIKTPVLILSMHPEDQYAVRVLKAGASGYLTKESASEELVTAIRRIISGRKYITLSLAEKLANDLEIDTDKPIHELISDREFQVLNLIASGKTVSEIAVELSLSVTTISTYRSRILEKMNMKTNAELTHYAIQKGIAK
jgi:two-component system invasion response regulator UvrY